MDHGVTVMDEQATLFLHASKLSLHIIWSSGLQSTLPARWSVLFRDPGDGRLWELTYPESGSQGGGPPRLTCIDADVARKKFGSVA